MGIVAIIAVTVASVIIFIVVWRSCQKSIGKTNE